MPLKLLAVGDLHLGRVPTRLPEELVHQVRKLGPAGALQRIVDTAIKNDIHVVVLAGDVVEEENDFFEAYRQLSAGVKRLLENNIRVFAVAGNHDVQILPRLADHIEGFCLLGREGQWQQETLEIDSEIVTLHGWSFPHRVVKDSPLTGQHFKRGSGFNLGLLHCDRDQAGSPYAPVSTRELESAGLDGWLLGHIHTPDKLSFDHPVGYLGSAVALDPGHPGARGPWLITIQGGRILSNEHWALSPLHWDHMAVDLTGIEIAEDARDRLLNSINDLDSLISDRPQPPGAVGLRITFIGRTDLRNSVEKLMATENLNDLYAGNSRIHYFVERTLYATHPELDMSSSAQRADPPGLLARQILILERDSADPERRFLIQESRHFLAERAKKPQWQPLDTDGLLSDDETVANWLHNAGLKALNQLLSQSEAAK